MGRAVLNKPVEQASGQVLGLYYQTPKGGFSKSGSHNGSWGNLNNEDGVINANTSHTGYTIQKTGSYLHLRFAVSFDHGGTWRASNIRVNYSTNNWSSTQGVIQCLAGTSWMDSGDYYGDSGLSERMWLHGYSAGTVIKFGWQDSGHNSGNTNWYNTFSQDGDNGGETHGTNFGSYLRVMELDAGAVSAMHSSNNFGSN